MQEKSRKKYVQVGKNMYTRVEWVKDWALTQGGIGLFIPSEEGYRVISLEIDFYIKYY